VVNKEREFVAVAEQAVRPQVVLYDIQNWRKRRVLTNYNDANSKVSDKRQVE
jgi:hypothetical protein